MSIQKATVILHLSEKVNIYNFGPAEDTRRHLSVSVSSDSDRFVEVN